MKNIIVLCALLAVVGCDKTEPVNESPVETVSKVQKSNVVEVIKTPAMAHKFANEIYTRLDADRAYIFDAYESKEKDTLLKLQSTFASQAIGTFKAYGDDSDETLAPYYACDNAYLELNSLLFDLHRDLEKNNADSRKQVRYRKLRFDKAFEKCQARVAMSPEDAIKAYDTED
ncbi:MAG: hypothetical protein CR991_11825 [Proteobacteria bacterium]|nr:MAG: hypothetical protein CR991_11825 [Pseudomonadota bacterium]